MPRSPGQNSGQPEGGTPPGYTWADYVAELVEAHGTLTAVAWKVLAHSRGSEDVESVERALRRLRARGQREGGVWGQRLLRALGVPAGVEARVSWMGLYHSPFNDLPLPLCLDQLRLWDRPPVSASRARVWIHLGFASCALRRRAFEDAEGYLGQARQAVSGAPSRYDAARVEIALAEAYAASGGEGARGRVEVLLDEAEATLGAGALGAVDEACFRARLADQRAFIENRRRTPEGDARALALYEALPREDVHPFASYRRDAGLAYGYLRAGRREEALLCAERACRHAGDGGFIRLRVMGLLMKAKVLGRGAAEEELRRARGMAARLEDEELLARVARAGG